MTVQVSSIPKRVLLSASVLFMTACAAGDTGLAAPTAYGPLPSPRPAFTGLALPATIAPSAKTPTPANAERSASPTTAEPRSGTLPGTTALTILYTNDTRGYVDPCG